MLNELSGPQEEENELVFQEDDGGASFGISSVTLRLFRSTGASGMFCNHQPLYKQSEDIQML